MSESVYVSPEKEANIIKDCEDHERQGDPWRQRDYRRCVHSQGFFVKFGDHGFLYPVYKTQAYISQLAAKDPCAPHIPAVYHFFTNPNGGMAYLVMEYITFTTSDPDLFQKIAQALEWLRHVPAPPGLTIGGLGGGPARHMLFKMFTAPLAFTSAEALEKYMNRSLRWIPPKVRPDPIRIADEPLFFSQSDMNAGNFGVDADGRVCMFDFATVVRLPASFASYTLWARRFATQVAAHLDWPDSPNLDTMRRMGYNLTRMADATLGLDENGDPKLHH